MDQVPVRQRRRHLRHLSSAEIELQGMPASNRAVVRQRLLGEILEPRARELFHMLRDNLRQGGVLEALGAGCVFTGGGARLTGLLDVAESQLRVPARIGSPVPLSRMPRGTRSARMRHPDWNPALYPPHQRACVRRKTIACAPNCAPSSPEAYSRDGNDRPGKSRSMNHPDEIRIQYNDEIPRGARIKVIGVGGGGGNAVNRMICRPRRRRRVHRRQHRSPGTAALAGSRQAPARHQAHQRPRRRSQSRRRPSRCPRRLRKDHRGPRRRGHGLRHRRSRWRHRHRSRARDRLAGQ